MLLFIIFFIGFVVLVLMQFLAVFTTDAPFVSTPKIIECDIVNNLELGQNSVLYDLGCGDASILLKAVKQHTEIKAVGIDAGFIPYLLAKFYTRNYKNIKIKRENIFKTDISDATHIFLYLYPKVINKLINNIREQCKPGTRIVSCDFELTNITPTKIIKLNKTTSPRGKKLFIYIV